MKKTVIKKENLSFNLIKILFLMLVILFFSLCFFKDKINSFGFLFILIILGLIWIGLIAYGIYRHYVKKHKIGDEYFGD
jgi:hypothetical protein